MKEMFRAVFVGRSTEGQRARSKNSGEKAVGWWSGPVVNKTESGS